MAEYVVSEGMLLRKLRPDEPFIDIWSEARGHWNVWPDPPDWSAGRPVSAEEASELFPAADLTAETVTDGPSPTWPPPRFDGGL